MTSEKLVFDGGTLVRATPMPPRIGFGPYAMHGTIILKLSSDGANE